jgi:hypothetical protein
MLTPGNEERLVLLRRNANGVRLHFPVIVGVWEMEIR